MTEVELTVYLELLRQGKKKEADDYRSSLEDKDFRSLGGDTNAKYC